MSTSLVQKPGGNFDDREPNDGDFGDVGEVASTIRRPELRPTSLSREDVEDFRIAFQETFGELLPYEEAVEQAESLLRFMRLIYRPLTHAQLARTLERQRELGGSGILEP